MTDNNNYLLFYTYDEPVPYKNLKIYPITMRKYIEFMYFVQCLLLDKNSESDINIISMSYLEYLLYLKTIREDENQYLSLFQELLRLCTKNDELAIMLGKSENKRIIFTVGEDDYDGEDFDNIKRIICEQNDVAMIDESIQKEVRDNWEAAIRYKQKLSGYKQPSVEDELICVMISTSLKLEEVYNLTIRKFKKILERVDAKLHYEIYLGASMSGFVKFENKNVLRHWTSDLSKGKYEDVMIEEDSLKDKVDLNLNEKQKK